MNPTTIIKQIILYGFMAGYSLFLLDMLRDQNIIFKHKCKQLYIDDKEVFILFRKDLIVATFFVALFISITKFVPFGFKEFVYFQIPQLLSLAVHDLPIVVNDVMNFFFRWAFTYFEIESYLDRQVLFIALRGFLIGTIPSIVILQFVIELMILSISVITSKFVKIRFRPILTFTRILIIVGIIWSVFSSFKGIEQFAGFSDFPHSTPPEKISELGFAAFTIVIFQMIAIKKKTTKQTLKERIQKRKDQLSTMYNSITKFLSKLLQTITAQQSNETFNTLDTIEHDELFENKSS